MKKENRFNKFLLEKEIEFHKDVKEGLNVIHNNISEEEARKNVETINYIYGVYHAVAELFDANGVVLNCGGGEVFFSIPEEDFNHYACSGHEIRSPKLDREKLQNATYPEIAGAIIDLIRDRKNWNIKMSSKKLEL